MKNVVKTDKAPGAIGPYSQGINVGDLYNSLLVFNWFSGVTFNVNREIICNTTTTPTTTKLFTQVGLS